jgi:hypothetical protein
MPFLNQRCKMAILSNGWAQHFRSIVENNDANKNMKAFTDAFAPATTLAERVNALVKEVNAAVLLVEPGGTVLQTHSWGKFGGTRSRPNFIVESLIGTGPRASAVVIDHGAAVASSAITILAATKTANRGMIEEHVALAGGGPALGGTMAPWATTASMTTASPTEPQAAIPASRTTTSRPADEEQQRQITPRPQQLP